MEWINTVISFFALGISWLAYSEVKKGKQPSAAVEDENIVHLFNPGSSPLELSRGVALNGFVYGVQSAKYSDSYTFDDGASDFSFSLVLYPNVPTVLTFHLTPGERISSATIVGKSLCLSISGEE